MPCAYWIVAAGALWGCAACAPLGPDYARPALDIPANWKTLTDAAPAAWQPAHPADAAPKQAWWTRFADAQLNVLEARCLTDNPSLQAAVACLDQALAQSKAQSAAELPSVQLDASAVRSRISANRPLLAYTTPNASTVQTDYRPVLAVNYEFDWLGKIRREVESARASAEQAAADRENVRLVLTAQLAATYFQLRQLDEEIAVLRASTALQNTVLELVRKRYQLGAANLAELAQQSALTQSSLAQLALLQAQRNQQEDALATLAGIPAADFHLAEGKLPATLPSIPLIMPSQLLERRPDIAVAERAMAAANAQIGVAQAAFFPTLALAPTYDGYESNALSNLLSVPSLVWSLGVSATQTLFDAGRNRAGIDFAKAGYAGAVANYRQSVLTAIQETQDVLSTVRQLGEAKQQQTHAVRDQDQAYRIGLVRYREGLDNAITLAFTQQNQLAAQRLETQIRGSQFVSAVSLVKALGGGWE